MSTRRTWTKFPNQILDNLDSLTGIEFKIVALMVRKNLGYQNPNKKFSLRYIMLKLRIGSKLTAYKSVQSLLEKGLIRVTDKSSDGYKYNVNWEDWGGTESVPVQKMSPSGTESVPPGGTESVPIIRKHILKENRLKERLDQENLWEKW